jgi:sugar phosphate permease
MEKTIAPSRWYRLIPIAFITYSLAYLDRANFGFAAASGMAADLHITPSMSSLLASLFFLGYFFFRYREHYMQQIKVQKNLSFGLLYYGAPLQLQRVL